MVNLYPDQTIRVQPFSTSIENCEISPLLSNPNDLGKIIWKSNPTFTFYATKQNFDRAAVKGHQVLIQNFRETKFQGGTLVFFKFQNCFFNLKKRYLVEMKNGTKICSTKDFTMRTNI